MTKIKLPKPVQNTIKTLQEKGFEAYAVGGAVRSMLMNKKTKDWDFTTSAKPHEILKLFKDSFYNNDFGTVGVPIGDNEVYEITTYRTEQGYSNKRHPDEIAWGETLEEDLARRDFTINAMATDGKSIIDPYGGQDDIKQKHVRTVGDPDKRFSEDALRLMRAVRIAANLGFFIEEKTQAAISKNARHIEEISKERIRDELLRILASNYSADGILLLKNTKLLSHILPELEKCFGVEQKSPERHHIYDVGTHLIESLRSCKSADPIVRFATLLHDVGKPVVFKKTKQGIITFYNHEVIGASIARNITYRLRLPKKDRRRIVTLVRWHQFSVDERQTDSALRRFIRRVGKENLSDMLDLRVGDRLGGGARETSWRLELYKKRLEEVQKQPFSVEDLKVNGHDVMKIFDTGPGPLIGHVLEKLFAEVEEDLKRNTKKYLLKRIEKLKEEMEKEKTNL